MDIQAIREQTQKAATELVETANLSANDLFVLGISTSEVQGKHIGKHSSQEIGDAIIETLLSVLKPKGIFLAVQGCEHINRSLTLEREAADRYGLDEVSVVPGLDAGGAGSVAAYKLAEDPVVVEHIVAKAGMDIGDTAIGMHIKHVQIPVRLEVQAIGEAHLTALSSRPKKIGGPRAHYTTDHIQ